MTQLSEDASSNAGPPRQRKRVSRLLWGVLAMVLVVVLTAAVFLAQLFTSFDQGVNKLDAAFPDESTRPLKATQAPASDVVNILMLGSDSRDDAVEPAQAGAPSDQRSDSMMWVHIPADRQHIYLTSIMRDMWVDIPGHGEAKINAAMAFGGVPLVVETLEGLMGTRIDNVVVVDFEGFQVITDVVGGVEVDVPIPFTSTHGNFTFAQGPQLMDGERALSFVRERYAFPDGDFQRVRDQQIFLKALMRTVLTPATLGNPLKVTELVTRLSPYLSVNPELTAPVVAALAFGLRDVRGGDVVPFTLPTLGTGTSADGQSIVVADDAAIAAFARAVREDDVASYLSAVRLP